MEFRVLEGVPPDDVRRFLAIARRRTFGRDEIVFHHGDAADAVHLITKGRFALRVVSPLGQSAMLAVRGPGETFGEFALLESGARRSVTVSALEHGETLSIGGRCSSSSRSTATGAKSRRDIVVPLTQESLAELAGTARGIVNRVLREEQEQGAVLLERGRVRVLEPASLADRVRGLPR